MKLMRKKLKQVAEITSSKRIYMIDYTDFGIPFYRSKEIIDLFNHSEIQDTLCISEEKYEVIKNRFGVPQNEDMLFTSVGTIGIPYLVREEDKFYFKDGNLTWFRKFSPEVKSKFLFYLFQSPSIKKRLINYSKGSSQSAITIETLKEIELDFPPIQYQKKIADILSAYDDLIDANHTRIQLLEESARLLFREWFVYFRFPGCEKVRMVDVGGKKMPEGWKDEKLNKYVSFKRGVEPGSDNYLDSYEIGTFPFYRVSDLITKTPGIFVDEQYVKGALLRKKDIVVSLDGTVGIVSMGLEGSYSTGIRKLKIINNKINRAFLYSLMKSNYIQEVISAYAKGTTIQHAGEATKHMKVILPPQSLMNKFGLIAEPFLDEILMLSEQNKKLAQARDLLLPKLMSGEIELSGFKESNLKEMNKYESN